MSKQNINNSALIIGAGPGGLTAAYELSKMGIGSTILEADNQVGGISRTVNYNGYRFDIGGHRFFSKVPYVNELWHEILDEDFLLRPRLSRIHYRQHFYDYPLKITNALAGLGPAESFLVSLSYAKARFFPTRNEHTFEDWVSNRFGTRLYNIFFKNYTEKVWGIPCNEISADWAAQRIKNLSLTEALRSALLGNGKLRNGDVITTLIDQFHYPRLGPGMMWEKCQTLLNKAGNPTIHGQCVTRIFHRNGDVNYVQATNASGQKNDYTASSYISTMPLRELILALDPPPPDEVIQAAKNLRYRDYLTVVLILNREKVFPDNWIYIHTPEVKMGRIQNYKNWSPEMVPDSSKTSLGLEYFLWKHDEEWTWSNDRLIELGIRECSDINLIEASEILDGTIVRMEKAYPVYDQNYHDSVSTIKKYLKTFSNLQTIGRNGLHRYNNQDHSMMTAVYAAQNIERKTHDVWAVNTDMEYHETDKKTVSYGDRFMPKKIEKELNEVIKTQLVHIDPVAMGISIGTVLSFCLFFITIFVLLTNGDVIKPAMSLLSIYFFKYNISWPGAFIGLLESAIGGFAIGYLLSKLMNTIVSVYLSLIQKSTEVEQNKNLLDKV